MYAKCTYNGKEGRKGQSRKKYSKNTEMIPNFKNIPRSSMNSKI